MRNGYIGNVSKQLINAYLYIWRMHWMYYIRIFTLDNVITLDHKMSTTRILSQGKRKHMRNKNILSEKDWLLPNSKVRKNVPKKVRGCHKSQIIKFDLVNRLKSINSNRDISGRDDTLFMTQVATLILFILQIRFNPLTLGRKRSVKSQSKMNLLIF